jgi:hypothetical protein
MLEKLLAALLKINQEQKSNHFARSWICPCLGTALGLILVTKSQVSETPIKE